MDHFPAKTTNINYLRLAKLKFKTVAIWSSYLTLCFPAINKKLQQRMDQMLQSTTALPILGNLTEMVDTATQHQNRCKKMLFPMHSWEVTTGHEASHYEQSNSFCIERLKRKIQTTKKEKTFNINKIITWKWYWYQC